METFIDSGILPRITELFESFIGWLGRSSVIESFTNAVSRAVDFLLGPSINVGGDDPTEAIYERQGGFIDRILADIEEKGIGQVMKDLFVSLGSTLMESAWTAITDGIKSLWKNTYVIEGMIAGIALLWGSKAVVMALAGALTRNLLGGTPLRGTPGAGAAGAAGGRGAALRGILGRVAGPAAIAAIGYEFFKLYQRGPASDELMQELRDSGQFETFQEDWMNQPDSSDSDQSTGQPPDWWPSWMPTASRDIQTPQPIQQNEAEQARRNLIAEREQIMQEAMAIGMTSQEQQERLAEIYSQLATQTESTNTMITHLETLNTTMTEVRDTERSMLELEKYLTQITEEQLSIELDIKRNTGQGSDISSGGITNFRGGR